MQIHTVLYKTRRGQWGCADCNKTQPTLLQRQGQNNVEGVVLFTDTF